MINLFISHFKSINDITIFLNLLDDLEYEPKLLEVDNDTRFYGEDDNTEDFSCKISVDCGDSNDELLDFCNVMNDFKVDWSSIECQK